MAHAEYRLTEYNLILRTRISTAVKAIKSLGGEADDINHGDATDKELQSELEELTNQYKRLKNSEGPIFEQ